MKKTPPDTSIKPGLDHWKHRPLDTQGADAEDIDASTPSNTDLRLPHEHDEGPKSGTDRRVSSSPPPRQVIDQAASDITRGLRDTERRGIPSDVPAQGPKPENSPGGEVPAEGLDKRSTSTRDELMQDGKRKQGG
jgi:hypothetical protein